VTDGLVAGSAAQRLRTCNGSTDAARARARSSR